MTTLTTHQRELLQAVLDGKNTPTAEQQAIAPESGAVYAELPAPTASIGIDDAWHEPAMRDFADRTHALRMQAAPKAAPGDPDKLMRDYVKHSIEPQLEAKWGTQPQAGAVPQGWKAVPVNPTQEMWKAAKTVPGPNPPYPPHYGLVWDAMLAASPTPPAEHSEAEADAQLFKFYGVSTTAELIAAQARHIEKLQAKIPPTPSFAPQRVREG